MTTPNPLDIRLGDYLEHLTDNNWHTLRLLIELERNLLTEDGLHKALSAYLMAQHKLYDLRKREREHTPSL
jgi:hypothetical protein